MKICPIVGCIAVILLIYTSANQSTINNRFIITKCEVVEAHLIATVCPREYGRNEEEPCIEQSLIVRWYDGNVTYDTAFKNYNLIPFDWRTRDLATYEKIWGNSVIGTTNMCHRTNSNSD
jgi:hypothetical protein